MASDYYQILGISKNATADEIKRAYRKLALQYHPDRNKTKEAEDKFKEVTHAYEVLSDSQKRQTYDQFGHTAFEQGAGQGPFGGSQGGQYGPFSYSYTTNTGDFDFGGFSDPFEIFEQFFGGGSPFGSRQRRPVYSLTIDFMEAVKGTQKKITMEGKTQTVKIPAGIDNGSRIRFDTYDLIVQVKPNTHFQRDGYDVITEEEISFVQATLGTEVKIKTIDGMVTIKIPQATQPGTVIRLRGKGITQLRGLGRGDHYVRIKVIIPKHLTHKQKQLLEEFEEPHKKKTWF